MNQKGRTREQKAADLEVLYQHAAQEREIEFERFRVLIDKGEPIDEWETYNMFLYLRFDKDSDHEHRVKEQYFSTIDSNQRKWTNYFFKLLNYKKEYGHCNVPNYWEKDTDLSKWVIRQRYHRRLFIDGKHALTTFERISILEGAGLAWDLRDDTWDTRYNEICQLMKIHNVGSITEVPLSRCKNGTIRSWLHQQR
jgi:hypothetical protein